MPEISGEAGAAQPWWAWLVPIGLAVATVAWGLLIYFMLPDRPRDWQYGILPSVPGETFTATQRPRRGAPPPQVEAAPPLPRGRK